MCITGQHLPKLLILKRALYNAPLAAHMEVPKVTCRRRRPHELGADVMLDGVPEEYARVPKPQAPDVCPLDAIARAQEKTCELSEPDLHR